MITTAVPEWPSAFAAAGMGLNFRPFQNENMIPMRMYEYCKCINIAYSSNEKPKNKKEKNAFSIISVFVFSQIYCHGPLLHAIQMAELFKDSKTFVDMHMKYNPGIYY